MKARTLEFAKQVSFLFISSLLLMLGQAATVSIASAHTSTSLSAKVRQSTAMNCPQPPQNVNLMTLSDAQLQFYGLPPHTTLDLNPTHWFQILAHAKHRSCGTTPDPTQRTQLPHPNAATCPQPTSLCKVYTWAGNVAQASLGTYRGAEVTFYVPSIPTSPSNANVSIWAGVGGDEGIGGSDNVLVQAGVGISISNGRQYNESFWELSCSFSDQCDTGRQNLPLTALYAGDEVNAYAESNLNNDGYDYFFIDNLTLNSYNSYRFSTVGTDDNSDGATGECIVERPSVNGGYTPLPQFGTEELYGCAITSEGGGGSSIGNLPHHYDEICNYSGCNYFLATVGAITNGGYDYPVYWKAGS